MKQNLHGVVKNKKITVVVVIALAVGLILSVFLMTRASTVALAKESFSNTNETTFVYDEGILDLNEASNSESINKANLTKGKENVLETELLAFEAIDEAQVTLVIDETSSSDIFIATNNSSANIVLTTNRTISEDEATKIATLVSKSVKDLQTKNIQIIDQNSNVLFSELE